MKLGLRWVFFALLVLFLISAFIGALISYNPLLAWSRFTAIAIGVVLCLCFAIMPVSKSQTVIVLLPAFVVIYFLLTNDWTSRLGKVIWLDSLLGWFVSWQPHSPGLRLDSNSFGGVIAALLPVQIAALSMKGRLRTWGGIVLAGVSVLGLFLSESRGAWLALVVVGAIGGLGQLTHRIARDRSARTALFVSMAVFLVIAGVLGLNSPVGQSLVQGRSDRLSVWRNSFDLATDYPFTGLGLGGFEMAYSSYMVLLHVGHTIHAHNLFLDVWLEQGLIGLVALIALMVGVTRPGWNALQHRQALSAWHVAALASLGVIVFHGITDDPFYGYGGTAIPFLFLPLGVLASAIASDQNRLRYRFALAALGIVVVTPFVAFVIPGVRASFVANLGALAQTRAELSVYHWPDTPIQDELRRSNKIDLSPAITQYQLALAIDPNNATANRRLGQIELSRGQYASAQRHLQVALASSPNQRATRQLLGESYAIAGDTDQARALWLTIDVSDGQLPIRQWWYEYIGDNERMTRISLIARMLGVGREN